MCYSAQAEQDIQKLERLAQARADYDEYERLFARRLDAPRLMIPKAMEANFYHPKTPIEKRIAGHIEAYHQRKTKELEAELFKQKKRLADATRKLAMKETKKAREDQRIANNKIQWHVKKIGELKRKGPADMDSRIFPMWHAPVIVMEGGQRLIKPMRYHCRPQGKPASYDKKYDGLYNARRDSLERFWKGQFSHTHGVMVMHSFYENVALHDYEHRELRTGEKASSVVLHFNPKPRLDMLVACLWSRWQSRGEDDLLSFAAITDDPPPEIAATGHERCIIPLREQNLGPWLQPGTLDPPAIYALLDDRERPRYEHALAA